MIAKEAFEELFPEKNSSNYDFDIIYTNKFKPYNANVRYTKNSFQFNLSKSWKNVSKEIQIGLLQGLLLRVFKHKNNTLNIDLYNNFMKNLHIVTPKTKSDPVLEESFNKVNEKHFFGLMEMPNLVWHGSIYRLGTYEYGTDTISISKILSADKNLMDYVMYHEMLHKKLKFNCSNGRTHHHTQEFKEMEAKFENSHVLEEELKALVRQGRRKRFVLFG